MATDHPGCREVMVPMRDGIRLATDVYLPAGPGPFPVLLERTPYGKRLANRADRTAADPEVRTKPEIAARFVAAGYAFVLQDCRGRYGSEGSFTKYLAEGEDGEDTLAWLIAQPWCDGKVGTLGLSYGAHAQAALACGDPPGLGAMFLDSGGFSSAYHSGIRQGGAFELKQLTWARKHALLSAATQLDPVRKAALEREPIEPWMARRWRPGSSPVSAAPEYEDYVLAQWDNDTFSPFWQQRGLYARGWYDRFADVPQVHMASWYDPYAQTACDNCTGLASQSSSPVRLVLGPWTHGQRSVSFSGDVDFGPAATLDGQLASDYVALRRAWFDHHLRGIGDDPLPDPVTYFTMGGGSGRRNRDGRLDHGGEWRRAPSWPPPAMQPRTLFLGADGALDASVPLAGEAGFIADPHSPVPTIGGAIASGAPVMAAGAFDQREVPGLFGATSPGRALCDRDDVACFRTAPLHEPLELTGNLVLHLFVSATTPDADIAVKLIDEYPPSSDYPQGFAMNLAHGILRLRFRDGFDRAEPMEPGTVYAVTITCFPTSNRFAAGHRLRIDLAGSNFPHFDVNPNCDWRVPAAQPQVTRLTIHCGGDHASRAELPVVPIGG